MAARKNLIPGDLVLGLGDSTNLKMRTGTVIAISGLERDSHHGCEHRLLILWSEPVAQLIQECDCGILVPLDIGL